MSAKISLEKVVDVSKSVFKIPSLVEATIEPNQSGLGKFTINPLI